MILLFNKPFRVLSQFTTDSDKATLADYIDIPGVYCAGRLDYDSEGLLVLTDEVFEKNGKKIPYRTARLTPAGYAVNEKISLNFVMKETEPPPEKRKRKKKPATSDV